MSKKLYSTEKWKSHLKVRQDAEMRKAQERNREVRSHTYPRRSPRPKRDTIVLPLPNDFSIIHNPEETVQFLLDFENRSRKKNIKLDLSALSTITTDAIAALIACIHRIRMTGTLVSGNSPNEESCKTILLQSGFFSHVRHRQALPSADKGKISQRESKKVEPKLAQELVHRGTAGIYGQPRKCQAAYRVLIESMTNTNNHAARSQFERETWWSTVYADTDRKAVCYTFLDTGVGIFKSVRLGTIRSAYQLAGRIFGFRSDADILREILEGKVESSTGLKYRGKGLPAIYNRMKAGRIK